MGSRGHAIVQQLQWDVIIMTITIELQEAEDEVVV